MRIFLFLIFSIFNLAILAQVSFSLNEKSAINRTLKHTSFIENGTINNGMDSHKFRLQYRNIVFALPNFYFDGRTTYLNISRCIKKIEFGIGINSFGNLNKEKLSPVFAPTDEWISKSNISLLYLDIPIYYEIGSCFNLKYGKLYVGVISQFLIAGNSQFVTQLENPSVVHNYNYFKDPDYFAFNTKWNMRLAIEYRIPIFRHFELGINLMENIRSIAPEYFQVNHSFFPVSQSKKVKRIGGLGLTLGVKF